MSLNEAFGGSCSTIASSRTTIAGRVGLAFDSLTSVRAYAQVMARLLDRYELVEVLGTGAFATVWRAHDPVLRADVAIKVLADNWCRDIEMRSRFLAEARNALELTNEHLIRVHHVAEADDDNQTPYIVMALADAGTLEERNRRRRLLRPNVRDSLRIVRDVALAAAALHQSGLIHRDLKPGNVLFCTTASGEERLVLGDFGLARALNNAALTAVAGTPAYAAPEQAQGLSPLTPQVDLYPLGVMFLELVTGELPTDNETFADVVTNEVDISKVMEPTGIDLDPQTSQLLSELLDPKPENRPASAGEVARRIDEILGTEVESEVLTPNPMPKVSTVSPLIDPTYQDFTPSNDPRRVESLLSGPKRLLFVITVVLVGVVGVVILGLLLA